MAQFLLLLVLAGETHAFFQVAAETECNLTQATSPCFPTVGGSAYIILLRNATGYKLRCYKYDLKVFSLKRGKLSIEEEYRNKVQFLIDTGTLKISNVERIDTGQYRVESFDPDGIYKGIYFNLQVKENILLILNSVRFAMAVLLTVVLLSCMCSKLKPCRASGGSQANEQNLLKMEKLHRGSHLALC